MERNDPQGLIKLRARARALSPTYITPVVHKVQCPSMIQSTGVTSGGHSNKQMVEFNGPQESTS